MEEPPIYEYKPRLTSIVSPLKPYPNDKVICIMPCYNAQDTIEEAIKSIIAQSHSNWELIIVDDASTDKSKKVINKYLTDPRITLLQNKTNQGCYYSRNRALYHVKDKEWSFFTTHDSDDKSSSDRFLIYVNTFYQEALEGIVGVFNGKRWDTKQDTPTLKYDPRQHSVGTAWYTKDTFLVLGYYYPNRFGSDSEYKERALRLSYNMMSHTNLPPEKTIQFMNLNYAYTYTTGVASSPSLTIKYSPEERKKFAQNWLENHKSFTTFKDFYQDFTPNKEDL